MAPSPSIIDRIESIPTRELYFFALYRVLVAALLSALVFGPLTSMVGEAHQPRLAQSVSIAYLLVSAALLIWGRNERWLQRIVFGSVVIDIIAATLLSHALPGASAGISMSLLFNIAAAGLLLPLSPALLLALLACAASIAEYVWQMVEGSQNTRTLAELAMFVTSYLALTFIAYQIGSRTRRTQQLADRRGVEVANLFEVNELIIRRMRTGVLVVDATGHITLANEAATALLGDMEGALAVDRVALSIASPELARRLQRWRNGWHEDEPPLQLAPEQAEVLPRFARLLADSDMSLIFLDDTTVVSRRAESLTLSTLGRFSASLAHEIRNPLAAINYATQLLEESEDLGEADRRLLQIIHQQCQRTNGIVESVLALARRERANPENLDLAAFVRRFVLEYRQTLSLENDSLEAVIREPSVVAMMDPRHLHQVLTALVHNALKYGRMADEPARIRIRVASAGRNAVIDVMDRGPGIPDAIASQLFRPFYTTSEHGTGLGLYIARELCRANQAQLDYVSIPAGGACFRLTLSTPKTAFTRSERQ
ncbi:MULTISPECIES: ATP-binding protein [Stenotrophomonas]|uniref:sensor histidine kinase n=1 Tax=Stenotrophomonas TaxID=40323 RepID=UPI00076FE654|nr:MULTISPECIES: ATP-binding protein [Stenotrophomonas]AMJ56047.1 PAS domain-containing sensor histidine kinase [Stenotrophomonas sp. KCTC 12332]